MNSMKRQKDDTERWTHQVMPNVLPEESEEIATEGMNRLNKAETVLSCGHDW